LINLFDVFYNSGKNFKECLNNGPQAIMEAISGCNAEDLKSLACKLAISAKDLKGMDSCQMTAVIVNRVVATASHGMQFGDYE